MPEFIKFEFADGRKWYGCFYLVFDYDHIGKSQTQVLIPTESLDGLSNEDIGKMVRGASSEIEFLYAEHIANLILQGAYSRAEDEQDYSRVIEQLTPYKERSSTIVHVLSIIAQKRDNEALKQQHRVQKKAKRNQLAASYNTYFMAIGRRDGFHCSTCKKTSDLQIDHIQPLARGGSNELDNLQLLCGTCNVKKGISQPDYRPSNETV